MKPIKIIKRKQSEDDNQTPTESQKSDEPSTSKIVNTIKGWIAESQQRKRNHRPSLTTLGFLILLAFAVAMAQSPASTSDRPLTDAERAIKVTIATTDGFLGPAAKLYKVGVLRRLANEIYADVRSSDRRTSA
jgi:hypothetical protein